jgi:hypothetical protein
MPSINNISRKEKEMTIHQNMKRRTILHLLAILLVTGLLMGLLASALTGSFVVVAWASATVVILAAVVVAAFRRARRSLSSHPKVGPSRRLVWLNSITIAAILLSPIVSAFSGLGVSVVSAGVVGMQYVTGTSGPDTRGGMVLDDDHVWISAHKNGLWRVDRCTAANAGDTTGNDGAAWNILSG